MTVDLPTAVRDLALRLAHDESGLPAYVYDLGSLSAHAAAIRAALPSNVQFYYAVKANPDLAVLRALAGHADGFEVSSAGEVAHTISALPGVPLAFGGPGKAAAELAAGVRAGVARFHVESPHELRLLDAVARAAGRTADVLFRVNLALPAPHGDRAAAAADAPALIMGGTPSSFGMDSALLEHCTQALAATGAVRVRGLHAHLASGLGAGQALAAAARLLEFGRPWCVRHGIGTPEFNLGGGMGVDYGQPGATFDWAGYGRGLAALARDGETLRIEPGRAVTAYCGWYLSRVLDLKHSHGQAFAIIAGGTHHLRTPAARGHSQPFAVIPRPGGGRDRPGIVGEPVTITGQLCTPRDTLATRVPVRRLRAGDLIAFGLAGAYAWNISHHSFLMHPPPAFCYLRAEPGEVLAVSLRGGDDLRRTRARPPDAQHAGNHCQLGAGERRRERVSVCEWGRHPDEPEPAHWCRHHPQRRHHPVHGRRTGDGRPVRHHVGRLRHQPIERNRIGTERADGDALVWVP
jgi:diaminopimelate decarboxylase